MSHRLHLFTLAAVCGATAAGASRAQADQIVYNTTNTGGDEFIDQQTGNNYYYIGDTASVAPASGVLTTISIPFLSASLGSSFTYTPDITLDLYPNAADAAAGTGKFGSAEVNDVTFTNDGVVDPTLGYNAEDEQLLTFNFTSQNITLPASFVFAYHDSPPAGSSVDGANGLSVLVTDGLATAGAASQDYFDLYPNSDPSGGGDSPIFSPGYSIEAQIDATPEPASLGLIGISSLLLLRRRRRSA